MLEKLHEIVLKTKSELPGCSSVFIPMAPVDLDAFHAYAKKHPEDGLKLFEYGFDFRRMRRAIADARLVVTMKHHPIIFAVGEDVPVVGLAFSAYYEHKNTGALGQYGIADLSTNLESKTWLEDFTVALEKALRPDWFRETVRSAKSILRKRKEAFLRETDALIE